MVWNAWIYETPAGKVWISDNGKSGDEAAVTGLDFVTCSSDDSEALTHAVKRTKMEYRMQESRTVSNAAQQLMEYLQGERREFDLRYELHGTEFQQMVWNALLTIPYGETRTYGQIASQIGRPKAVRAVGGANHCNPVGVFIPCHRVIGSNGTLIGYAGGLEIKKFLLELENSI